MRMIKKKDEMKKMSQSTWLRYRICPISSKSPMLERKEVCQRPSQLLKLVLIVMSRSLILMMSSKLGSVLSRSSYLT